jgi:CxxC motif-containing protein (DUF1111 family)
MRVVLRILVSFALAAAMLCPLALAVKAQTDPGIRGGYQNTSGMLQYKAMLNFFRTGRLPLNPPIAHPSLIGSNPITGAPADPNEQASFFEGINRAGQLESTCDTCAMVPDGSPATGVNEIDPVLPQFTTNSNGLGARHNADQCFSCHSQPTLGGSGGFLVPNPQQVSQGQAPQPPENPQFNLIPHRFGKQNLVPTFETQYGPIREVRFIYKVDSNGDFLRDPSGHLVPDGGVHQLWTVKGINDPTIASCAISQPDFAKQLANHNLAFRIPLQMTGLGLIESIQDREILAHSAATATDRQALGIAGHPNRSGNDGTITRFGWKAQNKSITMFAGEAYNVEMGITNELFPVATEEDPACQGNNKPEPNDVTRTQKDDVGPPANQSFSNPLHILADWMQFQLLMRFTDSPQPDPNPSQSAVRGRTVFASVGCSLCHTPQMMTAPVMNSAVLQNRPANLFSDMFVHHMGARLADGITQGQAGPDEFRTTPLWGVGQRIFFLHDGRTTDLMSAVSAHRSEATDNYPGSEANKVIDRFNGLSPTDKQAILDFLRSL